MMWAIVILLGLIVLQLAYISAQLGIIQRTLLSASDLNLQAQERLLDQAMMIENNTVKMAYDPIG